MYKTRQVNKIILISTIILAALLIGGIYILKQRGDQARLEQAIALADQQVAVEKAREAQVSSSNTDAENDSDSEMPISTVVVGDSQSLPLTGTRFSAIEMSGLGLMTFSIVGYLRSRRYVA